MTTPSSDSELNKAINQFAMSATFWGLDKGLDRPTDMDSSEVRSKAIGEFKAAINQYIAQEIEAVVKVAEDETYDMAFKDGINHATMKGGE